MPILKFEVQADYDKVIKLREEIDRLEAKLRGLDLHAPASQVHEVEQQLSSARREFNRIASSAAKAGADIDNFAKSMLNAGVKAAGAIGVGVGLKDFVGQMTRVRGEFQQIETSLEVILGDKEKANALMEEVKDFAKVSPLDLKSTAAATQMMLGFNIEAEKVPRFLQAIGDVSMGDAQRFNSLTLAFSQMSATGKLMGQDLNQMINAGFNPLQIMAEKTGKSIATLKEEMSKGAISSQMVQQAFIDATDAGGKFYQMSERASLTINGQLSMLQDALDAMFNSLGESNEGVILDVIKGATTLVENYETVGQIIADLIVTYGVYRTAVITNIALTRSWAVAARADAVAKGIQTAATKAATIAQVAFNTAANANPYVLLATAVTAVGLALWTYSSHANKSTEAQEELNKVVREAGAAIASEQTNIDILFNRLRNAKEGTDEFAAAQKAIIDQYGSYLTGLVDEKNKLLDVAAAYWRVKTAVEESAKARAMESYNKAANDKYQESYTEAINKIQDEINSRVKNEHLRSTLMQLVRGDISNGNGLSKITMAALGDAFKERGRDDSTGVGKIRKQVKAIIGATEERNDSLKSSSDRFGSLQNEFESYNLKQLEKLKADLDYQIKDAKAVGGLKEIFIGLNDGTIKGFDNLADLETTRRKILDALGKKREEEKTKHDSNFGVQKRAAKKEWDEAKAELKKIEADQDKYSREQYDKAKQREQTAEAAYKNLGGDTTGKEAKAAAKAESAKAKAQREANKREDDNLKLKRDREQATIDLLEESSEKKIRQINLDYERQKDAINKQERDLKQGNKGKLTDEQIATIKALHEANESKRDKSTQEVYKADLAAMRDYLKQYGTYQQQKLAIAEEYAEKISKAQSEGERLTLARQRDTAIKQVDMNALEQTIDWQAVFGGFTGILEEQLRDTLGQLKKYTQTNKFKSSSAEDKKLIYGAIERIQQQLPGESKGTLDFGSITRQMQKFGLVLTEAQNAARADIVAQNNLRDAQEAYKQAVATGTAVEQQRAKTYLDIAQHTATGTATALNEANAQVEAMGSDLATTSKATVDGLNLVADGLHQFSSDSLSGIFAGLQNTVAGLDKLNLGGAVGNAISKLSSTLSSAGFIGQIISAILSILDVLKDGIGPLISGLIDSILGAVSGILDNILSGDMFVQIFKSLRDGIGNILNTITFGGFGSLMSSSNAKWVAEVTERLTDSNERLRNSVDKLKDEMSGQGGWKAIDTARQAAEDQKKINQQTMEILIAQMRYHGDHGSNASKWNLGKKDYDSINETLAAYARKKGDGSKASIVKSLEDIFKLTPEEMDYIRTYNVEMWRVMLTRGKYDKSEYWEQYADLAGQLEEITKQLQETLTQTSFDSLRSSFVDSLMDMTADAEDFADNLTEMLMRSVLNARISNELEDEIKAFYEKWAEYAESGSILDDKEVKELQEWWKRITDKGLQFRDEAAAITGYDKSSTSSQSATAGYSTQLSEDTGSEIVGRMTAMQDALYRIEALGVERNQLLGGNGLAERELSVAEVSSAQLVEMTKIQAEAYTVHTDCRRILAESYLELQQIRENTGAIIKPINSMKNSLEKIEKNTKEMI